MQHEARLNLIRPFLKLCQTKDSLSMQGFWLYILTNRHNKVLYVGSTNDLKTRLWEHQTKQNPNSFTSRYNITKLIYYEKYTQDFHAFNREKYIKGKNRKWKIDLINLTNKKWVDLSARFLEQQ